MTTPKACEDNYSCIKAGGGLIAPQVCGPGTFWDSATRDCTSCSAGKYCWPAVGTTGLTGDCSSQWVCQGGAFNPKPYPSNLLAISPSDSSTSDFKTYNGPSFPGHTPNSSQTNVACAVGQYRPGFYGETCLSCPAGRYCPNTGMSSADSFICDGGHICSGGSSSSDPGNDSGSSSGRLCPLGNYCEAGAYHEMSCADGFHGPTTGMSSCSSCPIGSYCNSENAGAN